MPEALLNSFVKSPHSVLDTHSCREPSQEDEQINEMLDEMMNEN